MAEYCTTSAVVLFQDRKPLLGLSLNRVSVSSTIAYTCPSLPLSLSERDKKLSYRRETARQLRIHAQLTRCFSAVAV